MALSVVLLLPLANAQQIESEWDGVSRIVAIGDVHGDYDNYLQVLREAGLINRRGKWSGGSTHFVQVGDVPDRGPDTAKILRHLMGLEKQAQKAGGYVHALIGNHEAMNIIGDLRYVHPGEYAALKSRRSKELRANYYQRVVDYLGGLEEPPVIDEAFREKWMDEHPLGYVEHRQIWHPSGEFGGWVTKHNSVIKINRTLFVHGGLGPLTLALSLQEMNEQIRAELGNPVVTQDLLSESEEGPLWYRGLSRTETELEAAHVDALLEHFDADRVVVGHTPGFGTLVPRFSSRVLAIDSGISAHYGGHLASLLIEEGELFTTQGGERIAIPESSEGLLNYYRRIAELEPDVKNLQELIYRLENPVPAVPLPTNATDTEVDVELDVDGANDDAAKADTRAGTEGEKK
ncbi:MAG: metallophosphoesterase [Congregibacter sp.]